MPVPEPIVTAVAEPKALTEVAVKGSRLNEVQSVSMAQPLTVSVPGTTRLPLLGTVTALPLYSVVRLLLLTLP